MSETMKAKITIENQLSEDLVGDGYHLSWGKKESGPSSPIDAFATKTDAFISEGNSMSMSGTEGWVKWKGAVSGHTVKVTFNCPYSGKNSAGATASDTDAWTVSNTKPTSDGGCSTTVTIKPA